MKPPVDLTNSLIFRVALPGAIAAAVFLPFNTLLVNKFTDLQIELSVYFAVAPLLYGAVLLFLDMPIYMLFEGRRYWPKNLRELGTDRHRRILRELQERFELTSLDASMRSDSLETALQIARYPITGQAGHREATKPTLLGNIIDEYELYPTIRYGLDGVFYYDRIIVSIPDDLRQDIDASQAAADSLLYTTFVFLCAAIFNFIGWLLAGAIGTNGTFAPNPQTLLAATIVSVGAACLTYRLALGPQERFGVRFKSIFDQYRDTLKLDSTIELMSAQKVFDAPGADTRERGMAVWRYLRWYRGRGTDSLVKDWSKLPDRE